MKLDRLLLLAVVPAMFTGCGAVDAVKPGPKPAVSEQPASTADPSKVKWAKVKASPPTFAPKALQQDLSMTADNGEWYLDRSTGASYYVPFRGAGDAEYDDIKAALPRNLSGGSGVEEGPGIGERISLDRFKLGKEKPAEG